MTRTIHPQQSEVKDGPITKPTFLRAGNNFFKSCVDGFYISVCERYLEESIGTENPRFVSEFATDVCTESEFKSAYKKVSQILEDRAK